MRKVSYLVLILALVLPLAIPFAAFAQGDPVLDALTAYNGNLPAGYGNVTVDDLAVEMIENPELLIVDVRTPEEYVEGHLEGAINISLRELGQNLDLLPNLDEEMVVYCGSGWRSALGMTSLQVLGYTNVRNMKGGIKTWNAEEYATTTDEFMVEASTAPDIAPELVAAVDAQLSALPSNWSGVGAEDLNVELIDNPPDLIIDVRTPGEWDEAGYVPGAVLMPLQELVSFVDELPAEMDANIVVYCKAGHRGNMAATMLRTLGYTSVRNLSGGFTAWAGAELPVEMAEKVDVVNAALVGYNESLPAGYGNVAVGDLAVEMIDDPELLIVDVRQPEEYAESHLEGAINIPLRELAQHLDMLPDLDEAMVVHCKSGWRSAIAMTSLQVLGYTDVRNMKGGFVAWTAEEFATTTDEFMVEAGAAPDIAPELVAAIDAHLSALSSSWGGVGSEDLNVELIDSPPDYIFDVRTPEEWAEGYIPGAVLMPLQDLMSYAGQWPEDLDANIVVYCKAGHRGNMAAIMLRTVGYTNVRNVFGGFTAWAGADFPVEMPE